MNECKGCKHYSRAIIVGRLGEFCLRVPHKAPSTAFERHETGECGPGGELFVSVALPSCRTLEEGRFA